MPRTPSLHRKKPRQTASVISYFKPNLTVSPNISSSEGKDDFPPYNTYWGALARAARAKPKLIQGKPTGGPDRLLSMLTCTLEEVACDWWKVLVAVMLLNKTTGKAAIPVFRDLMSRWPNPTLMAEGDDSSKYAHMIVSSAFPLAPMCLLQELLTPLGLQKTRADRIIRLSVMYLADPPSFDAPRKSRVPYYPPTAVSHLPGCGRYALDSFRIFCCPDEWMNVMPTDKELIKYLVNSILLVT